MLLVLVIALSAEGVIDNLDSRDASDITDNDEIYHTGQFIRIIATDSDNQTGLANTILITSPSTGYISDLQNLVDKNDGSYTFLWNTKNLTEASDYIAEVELGVSQRSLVITLDNTPPANAKIVINKGEPFTTNASVRLSLSAQDATEMYISGDVVNDANTFEWIPYAESIQARLTVGYKEKRVNVQFRDEARTVSETATTIRLQQEDTIILDRESPQILLDSQAASDITDNDEIYHAGQLIRIIAIDADNQTGLANTILITSPSTGYISGLQNLVDKNDGSYTFLWNTLTLTEASDYIAEVELGVSQRSLVITLDNKPPANAKIVINKGEPLTTNSSVRLSLSAQDATEMYISGDVVNDANTFEWIPYAESIQARLTVGYKEKRVNVQFRDEARNVSETATAIRDNLQQDNTDTEAPEILAMTSHDAADEMDNDGKYHAGEKVKFIVKAAEAETELKGTIRIRSSKVSYDSGVQRLEDGGHESLDGVGEYSYLWETTGLKEADDYVVEATLEDLASHQTTDVALAVTIDNTPPTNETLVINNSELKQTKARSVTLKISAEDSVQMWIEGDVVDDTNTFEWIPFVNILVVNLTSGDGKKMIRVRHKDAADNESHTAEGSIFLAEFPPVIQSVDSADKDDPTDSDGIYHAGQPIVILIKSAEAETGLTAIVQIRSEENTYDSGVRGANLHPDDGEGSYSYLWNTSGLKSASDYVVKVTLQDSLGQKTVDESLTITIDNEPPSNYELRITNYEGGVTSSGSILLEISAEDTVEMFIEGDIVEDAATFKWIPILETKEVQLTEGDGEKTVRVKFRDEALNESLAAEASITLDTTAPTNARILINGGETKTDSRAVILNLLAEEASEMYIDGDVAKADPPLNGSPFEKGVRGIKGGQGGFTFQWIPYESLNKVELTEGDGVKRVGIKYRDAVGNEGIRVESSITLDQPGPTLPSIVINDGETHTRSPTVSLSLSAEDATEMYIDGDVMAADGTFQWIPYQSKLQVTLIKSDGEKRVRARFRNGAGNQSKQVEVIITLDQTAPVVETVESYNANDPTDDDGIYHPGQIVVIKATAGGLGGVDGSIRIKSAEIKYDSSAQKLAGRGDGSYTYSWNTIDLLDAKDYIVEITLKDEVGLTAVDNSLLITIDGTAPVEPSVIVTGVRSPSTTETTFLSSSVNLHLAVEDAVEIFIEGDIINDTNTFQWIPVAAEGDATEIMVNLAGKDGEKNIKVRFRDAARNESENAEIKVLLELKKPRLLADVYLIQPDGQKIAYLVLPFDESIGNISKEDFYVNLSNPNKLEEQLELNAEFLANSATVEPVVDKNNVVIQITEEQVLILRSWEETKRASGRVPDEIWVQIAENSAFDLAGNGNLGNEGKPSVIRFTQPSLQAIVAPPEFSPNSDGVKDETVILYTLKSDSDVTVKIEDWRKHPIYNWELAAQLKDIPHELKWDGKKEDGSDCPDGTYTISIENIDTLTGVSVVAKTFSMILDTIPPQIIDKKPLSGGQILPTSEISVEVVDTSENQAASGIDEENVYVIFDNNPEQVIFLTRATDFVSSRVSSTGNELEGKYMIPSGRFVLESRKYSVTFHVADKAGNYTEETVEYTVVETGASPLLRVMNYPNPFKPGGSTTIRYVLADTVRSAVMYIYDASGNLVLLKHMKVDELESGEHRIPWDGKDLFGELLARGVYFCEFRVVTRNPENITKKLHKIAVW